MVMNKVFHMLLMALATLMGVCLAGCVRDDEAVCPSSRGDKSQAETYITLTLTLPSSGTRAVSVDGEEADGIEYGTSNEDRIDDISFFLFHIDGWDADGSAPVIHKGYFDKDNASEWTALHNGVRLTLKIKGYVPEQNDRVIVVANAGETLMKVRSLGALRDMTEYQAWRQGESLTQCDRFIISSAFNDPDNGSVQTVGKSGSLVDPYLSDVRMQRVAARIDFMYSPTENPSGEAPFASLDYKVRQVPGDASTPVLARMRLRHIIPFNVMQESSFITKRVTTDLNISSKPRYGGREERDADGLPTNYVLEPHTLSKGTAAEDLTSWYGPTRAQEVFAHPTLHLDGNSVKGFSRNVRTENGMTFFTVTYANENTQPMTLHDKKYMTGLLLHAVYVPLQVYADGAASVLSHEDFTQGRTFWRYTPSQAVTSENASIYFDNEAAALAYKAAQGQPMAQVTKFADGVCYYNVWIRHATVDQAINRTFPMEYGIVRNNIYRIEVDYVTGPGTPEPDYNESGHASTRIYVRKWNRREQPTIRL